jgi:hypothetical protein
MDGNLDFEPYDLKLLIKNLLKRPILSDMGNDHHTDEIKGIVG